MKKKNILAMIMSAVMSITTVAPQPALYVSAGDEMIIEETSDEELNNDTVSENEDNSDSDAVSENEAVSDNVADDDDLPEDTKTMPAGIEGMPEDYIVSEREAQLKADMLSHDVLSELGNAVAGVDYIEDQVYCIAESEEYAQEIAAAYGIELVEYNCNVAIFSTETSVRDVYETVELGLDTEYQLPPLTPNYICRLSTMDREIESGNTVYSFSSGQYVNTPTDWEDLYYSLGSDFDPFLYPNDPDYQWWHDMMDTYAALGLYGVDYSESGIKVAVIDGRVNESHEELSGNVKLVELTGAGSSAPTDRGSQVAGIIGAKSGNAAGGAGIAPGVQMYSLSSTDETGNVTGAYVTACLNYLENSGVNIACMSFGCSLYDANQEAAIRKAYENGVTLLAPAADSGEKSMVYPARYDQVISVGAVKQDGSKVYRSAKADVYAPGVEMMSTGGDGDYQVASGTSMACAAAAGACALYMSIEGPVSPDEMRAVLTKKTIKGKALENGAGIANIAKMISTGKKGPGIEIYDNGQKVKTVKGGGSASVTVNHYADIVIYPETVSDENVSYRTKQVFFTINGKAPSFDKDGKAGIGTYCLAPEFQEMEDGHVEEDFYINTYHLAGMLGEKKSYTFKAVSVSEMGEVSGVTTIRIKMELPWYYYNLSIPFSYSNTAEVSAGQSLQLKAELMRGDYENVKITAAHQLKWEIVKGKDIAGIGEKSGLLQTVEGKTGEVRVRCSCKVKGNTIYSKELKILVGDHAVIDSFALSESELELYYGKSGKMLSIIAATDVNGEDVLSQDYVQYKWDVSDPKVIYLVPSDNGRQVTVNSMGKGTATITCTALDGSNKTVKAKVTVRQAVVFIEIDGQNSIVAGSSVKYKAKTCGLRNSYTQKETVAPDDRSVTWYLNNDIECTELDGGTVSIDPKTGIVKVADNTTVKDFYVYVRANDMGQKTDKVFVSITGKKTTSFSVSTNAIDDAYKIKKNKKDSITSVQLHTRSTALVNTNSTMLRVKASSDSGTNVYWKSSNEAVVTLTESSGGEALLKAKGAGNATITCTAGDGSGKKVSFKVKVIVPVSHMMMTNDKLTVYPGGTEGISYVYLGKGKSTTMKAAAGDSYGKPDNTKIKWTYEIVRYDEKYGIDELDAAAVEKVEKLKLFTVKGAKVKINKKYDALREANALPERIGVLITATATDGSNVCDRMLIVPAE